MKNQYFKHDKSIINFETRSLITKLNGV